jgi:hypothetical protein
MFTFKTLSTKNPPLSEHFNIKVPELRTVMIFLLDGLLQIEIIISSVGTNEIIF